MLLGITTFFNPSGYTRPYVNFKKFADKVRSQELKLLTIEVAFFDRQFEIQESDSDILVRIRTDSITWHKERAFNLALQAIPDNCTGICWLDADILFSNDSWVSETENALIDFKVVQPFSYCIWLHPGTESFDLDETTYPEINIEGGRLHSFGFGWHHFGKHALEARILYGHVGFAWAARRDVIDKIGFYDADIFGSNDTLMAHAYVDYGPFLKNEADLYSKGLIAHYKQWARVANTVVNGDVGYVDGIVSHLWHGSPGRRGYGERLQIMKQYNFDPLRDIRIGIDGLYHLNPERIGLIEYCKKYYDNRKEDDPARNRIFVKGFYGDEIGENNRIFKWAESEALIKFLQPVASWDFELGNNILVKTEGRQTIEILHNGRLTQRVVLTSTHLVSVSILNINKNDVLSFTSDYDFCPADMGTSDTRRLSFMIYPN